MVIFLDTEMRIKYINALSSKNTIPCGSVFDRL